jgi:hypothetical protein
MSEEHADRLMRQLNLIDVTPNDMSRKWLVRLGATTDVGALEDKGWQLLNSVVARPAPEPSQQFTDRAHGARPRCFAGYRE